MIMQLMRGVRKHATVPTLHENFTPLRGIRRDDHCLSHIWMGASIFSNACWYNGIFHLISGDCIP